MLGDSDFYWRTLQAKAQTDAGTVVDYTFGHTTQNAEGFSAISSFLDADESKTADNKIGHLNTSFYFRDITQNYTLRNQDLNPCFITVYKCCVRKAFKLDDKAGASDEDLLKKLFDCMYSLKMQTNNTQDLATLAGGGLMEFDWTYRCLRTYDKQWSLYRARDFVDNVLIMSKKTYVVGPGQILKAKLKCKSQWRTLAECLPQGQVLPSTWADNSSTSSEHYNIAQRLFMNQVKAGKKAKFLIFKVSGFLGSKSVAESIDTVGRIAPNVVMEYNESCSVLPSIHTKPRYESTLTMQDGPFRGPSEFADAS